MSGRYAFLSMVLCAAVVTASSAVAGGGSARKLVLSKKVARPAVLRGDESTPSSTSSTVNPPAPLLGETAIDGDVVNLRALLGGGRHLIRHDCEGFPSSIDAVYSKANPGTGGEPLQAFDALSNDGGATWATAGPLSAIPDDFRDRDMCVGFGTTTYITYNEQGSNGGLGARYFTSDVLACLLAFNPATLITDLGAGRDEFFPQMVVTQVGGADVIYTSFIDFGGGAGSVPYECYFQKSTDGGASWSAPLHINTAAAPTEFTMGGTDGAMVMAADGDLIWGFVYANPDSAWAVTNGWFANRTLPAYTVSTDGGATWAPLRLLMGTDGTAVDGGHTGDPALNARIRYDGGTQDAGYSAFNDTFDNVVLAGGGPHFAFTAGAVMDDTLYLTDGIFHGEVEAGEPHVEYVGFPEDTAFSSDTSGVTFTPMVSGTTRGDMVIGWQEIGQVTLQSDVYIWAETASGGTLTPPRQNVTASAANESFSRTIPVLAEDSGTGPNNFFLDYIYLKGEPGGFGSGGYAATDNVLYHFQATVDLGAVGIGGDEPAVPPVPKATALAQNFPNPFNPATTIRFDLAAATHVTLEIYNLRGERVRELVSGARPAGSYTVHWDGRSEAGDLVPSGVYFYRLRTGGGFSDIKKMVALK